MLDKQPLVSVIMPCFNSESTVEQSIDSVLSSSYLNFELIIVNDGSSDLSKTLICGKANLDKRIIFIDREENKGLIYTLNEGIKASKGEYILRLDSDDLYLKDSIENLMSFMLESKADFVYGNAQIIDDKNNVRGETKSLNEMSTRQLHLINHIIHSSVCFKKELINELGDYDRSCKGYEDQELWVRFYRAKKVIKHLNQTVVKYRIVKNSCQDRDSTDYYFLIAQYLFRYNDKLSAMLIFNKVSLLSNRIFMIVRFVLPYSLFKFIGYNKIKNRFLKDKNGIYRPR